MRLIDADLLEGEDFHICNGKDVIFAIPLESIRNAPAVDAKPVIHARWQMPIVSFGGQFCTNCKVEAKSFTGYDGICYFYKQKYCPNCGAEMELQEEEKES